MFTENANRIFNRVIEEYHRWDDVDRPVENPYEPGTIDHLLYHKNWIDTVQWHLEDIIRDPQIDPVAALAIKRRIDKSNQERTDMVEYVDSYLLDKYREIEPLPGARLNTETPAWAIDRLSILALKIYHMACETERTDVDDAHRAACRKKLDVLLAQQAALAIKRRIDKSNQERTDMVEYVDSYLLDKYREIEPLPGARLNTETPAWAIDRLSILALKIYHMACETERTDVDDAHRAACRKKLDVLLAQQADLSKAIEELIEDIEAGRKYMKTYKQMKMYNDPALNPVLYGQKK